MSQFTMEWANAQNAKRMAKQASTLAPYDGEESDVHQKIIDHCKSMGWYYERDRMDKKTRGEVGAPDFTIAAREGRSAFIEVKRKGSKPTVKQAGNIHWLKSLGHVAEVVWSYEEFCEVVKGLK